MRDKTARRNILELLCRINRLEQVILDQSYPAGTLMGRGGIGGVCLKCSMSLYDGFVCLNDNCEHGLDADGGDTDD